MLRPVITLCSFAAEAAFSYHFDYTLYISYYKKEGSVCSGSIRGTYLEAFPHHNAVIVHASISVSLERGHMIFVYHGSPSKGYSVSK